MEYFLTQYSNIPPHCYYMYFSSASPVTNDRQCRDVTGVRDDVRYRARAPTEVEDDLHKTLWQRLINERVRANLPTLSKKLKVQ